MPVQTASIGFSFEYLKWIPAFAGMTVAEILVFRVAQQFDKVI